MATTTHLTRRQALALAAGAGAGLVVSPARASSAKRPTIVELFTSQGCSSCPPADAFMEELAKMENVFALTCNVDYWDYLGWRDTLASPAHSQRQYDYAKSRGDMDVYTPQIVIDGSSHYVGSKKAAIRAAIKRSAEGAPSLWVPMTLDADDKEFALEVNASTRAPSATVWLLTVAPRMAVKIEKGENAGRDMVYSNVVRRLMPAGIWSGDAISTRLPRQSVLGEQCKGCVALLQIGNVGPIIGAAGWGQLHDEA